jgi:hypothetical protein
MTGTGRFYPARRAALRTSLALASASLPPLMSCCRVGIREKSRMQDQWDIFEKVRAARTIR